MVLSHSTRAGYALTQREVQGEKIDLLLDQLDAVVLDRF
jgi:hypothetical protein